MIWTIIDLQDLLLRPIVSDIAHVLKFATKLSQVRMLPNRFIHAQFSIYFDRLSTGYSDFIGTLELTQRTRHFE